MEFETVRDALDYLLMAGNSIKYTIGGQPATEDDYKEIMREVGSAIADLIGIGDLTY